MQFIKEFKEFAIKGNVVELGVGVIIGTAFGKIVNSFVSDIALPPLSFLLRSINFSGLFFPLGPGSYKTIAEAQAAGVPTINYGAFLDSIISFFVTAFIIFLVVKQVNKVRRLRERFKKPAHEQ